MSTNRAETKYDSRKKVVESFEKLCQNSQTENQTTELKLTQEKAEEVLKQCGYNGDLRELLEFSSCEDGKVFLPTVVSSLNATLVDCRKFALIVVDVQNDFISGSLAVTGGAEVVPIINRLTPLFTSIYRTVDWHPADHISFHSNVNKGLYPTAEGECPNGDTQLFQTVTVEGPPKLKQTLWPDHCIQGSEGANFHPQLNVEGGIRINKGMNKMVDSYSGFWDNGDTSHTPLYSHLIRDGVTDVVVTGIATDYCVGFTALDSARHGFKTYVVEDAIRGVAQESSVAMIERCKAGGVIFISESDVPGLLDKTGDLSDILPTITAAKNHFSSVSK